MLDHCRHVAAALRQGGPVEFNCARHPIQLASVHHHSALPRIDSGQRREAALDVVEPALDLGKLAQRSEGPDKAHAEDRAGANKLDRQSSHPTLDDGFAAVLLHVWDGKLHELCRALEIPTGKQLADRLPVVSLQLVPVARSAMQRWKLLADVVRKMREQHVGEQVMVAKPLPPIVERDDEEVLAIQRVEHCLAAAATGHGIAERAVQPGEKTSVKQKRANLVRYTLQNLLQQIVDD